PGESRSHRPTAADRPGGRLPLALPLRQPRLRRAPLPLPHPPAAAGGARRRRRAAHRLAGRLGADAPGAVAPRPRAQAPPGRARRGAPPRRRRLRAAEPLPDRARDPGHTRQAVRPLAGRPRRRPLMGVPPLPGDALAWTVRPPAPPREVAALSRALGVPPAIAAILWARGLRDDAPDHLNPPLRLSPNPTLVEAAARLAEAVERGERVLIHGDYDADGITGTALLLLGLRELGGRVEA